MGQQTYYEILNIPSTATQDQIKAAYKAKLLATHPDKTTSITTAPTTTPITATPDINLILTAYTTLSSPQLRSQYDSNLQTNRKLMALI